MVGMTKNREMKREERVVTMRGRGDERGVGGLCQWQSLDRPIVSIFFSFSLFSCS